MTGELTALRARDLRHALMRIGIVASKRSLGAAEKEAEIVGICCAALNGEPTPDPRDARIAVLEAALREARDALEHIIFNKSTERVHAALATIDRGLGEETNASYFGHAAHRISDQAVAAARAEIVGWLREQEREAQAKLDAGPDDCDWWEHERDMFWDAANKIESGAPQRWAAEREQGRG